MFMNSSDLNSSLKISKVYADSPVAAALLRAFICFPYSRRWNNRNTHKNKQTNKKKTPKKQWRDKRSCQLRHGYKTLNNIFWRPRLTKVGNWEVSKLGWKEAVGITFFLSEIYIYNPLQKKTVPETRWVTTHWDTEMMKQNKFLFCASPFTLLHASSTVQVVDLDVFIFLSISLGFMVEILTSLTLGALGSYSIS